MGLFKQPTSSNWWGDHFIDGKRHRKSMGTSNKREAQRRARQWLEALEAKHGRAKRQDLVSDR